MNLGKQIETLKKMNWVMVTAAALLAVIGILFVYSACSVYEDQPTVRYRRQAIWMLIGVVCFMAFVLIDYRRLCKESWWIYSVTIVLLILVLFVGKKVYGGRRWLVFFGGLGFQPSEFAKLAIIIALAQLMCRRSADMGRLKYIVIVLALTTLPMVLIILEPDMGTAMVFLPVVFVMMFAAGVRSKPLLILFMAGLLFMALVLGALFLPEKLGYDDETQGQVLRSIGLKPYQKERIATFLSPGRDPLGAGWNKIQSEIAVGSGGLTGKGFRKGTSNILGFLPRTVAPTDFIFSVIAEETGFIGAAVILSLFGVIFTTGLRTAAGSTDKTGRLLCAGVTAMLFTHVFINIAMTVGLMPITGLPLPFMSSGGSFIISTMIGLGIIQSVHARRRLMRY